MRFPAFWTRVTNPKKTVIARGWSDISMEEATSHAHNRLQRILNALRANKVMELERYAYVSDGVICEEVIDRLCHAGDEVAVVSRNAYGALILNAANMMFVDIDFPRPLRIGCLAGLLSSFRRPSSPPSPSFEDQILERVRKWQLQHVDFGLRAYRTAAGIRLIVSNQTFEMVDETAIAILRELGSDALYIKLCSSQNCFRARLSPKPWRIGLANPPAMFPFDSPTDRAAFDRWYGQYLDRAKDYRVCTLLETLGPPEILPQHVAALELHDRICGCEVERPLA